MSSPKKSGPKQSTLDTFLTQWTKKSARGELGNSQLEKASTSPRFVPPAPSVSSPSLPPLPQSPKRKRIEEDIITDELNEKILDKDSLGPKTKKARIAEESSDSEQTAPLEIDEPLPRASSTLTGLVLAIEDSSDNLEDTIKIESNILREELREKPDRDSPLQQDALELEVLLPLSPPSRSSCLFSQFPLPLYLLLHILSLLVLRSLLQLPVDYEDAWDDNHARLPCSPRYYHNGDLVWPRIVRRLRPIANATPSAPASLWDFDAAIRAYSASRRGFNLDCLKRMTDLLSPEERSVFLGLTLPFVASLALRLPSIVTHPIRLLKARSTCAVTLSQIQCATLLANAFCCTMPHPRDGFAYFNFHSLFSSPVEDSKVQKLRSIVHYFERVRQARLVNQGNVSFGRLFLPQSNLPAWKTHDGPISAAEVEIRLNGTIEEDEGSVQADFANKRLGGGVLASGCVQEEIRFVICPELIVSRLIVQDLDANEALHIIGMERYSNYEGYAQTYQWKGDYIDCTPRDRHNRRLTRLVAFDALHYSQPAAQFRPEMIRRELVKAFVAFSRASGNTLDDPGMSSLPIATGNWGCGAFRGDRELKFVLQLIAAAVTNRSLHYYTFGDSELQTRGEVLLNALKEKDVIVGDLVKMLDEYYALKSQGDFDGPLFDFLFEVYSST